MFRSIITALALTVAAVTAATAQAPAPQTTPPAAAAPAAAPKAPVAVPATAVKAPAAAAKAPAPADAKATPAIAAEAAAKTAAPAKVAAAKKCMRLPLSDIAVGRDETIAQARMRLGEYAEAEGKSRKWGPTTKSLETVSCDVYLVLPLIGTEYKCLVTATFCTK
jgi:hypothetical protein